MNIVFDLGGVVVTWEPRRLIALLFDDPASREAVLDRVIGHPDWLELDRGTLAPRDAARRAASRTGLPETEIARLLDAVPASLVPIRGTVELMRRLKAAGHRLYCLSNMQFASIEHLEREHDFWDVFTGRVVSCRIGLCKPEPGVYAYLLDTHGIRATDTVFIDDVPANLAAAEEFGIRTVRFESAAQCERDLRRLGCTGPTG